MYNSYVSVDEYTELGYSAVPVAQLERFLKDASRNVDTLTFNRIVAKGFDRLTEFQKELIQEVVCKQADFLYENADAIASVLDKYAINGVSMEFGTGFNVMMENGVPTQKTIYALLEQTGLCWRGGI
jgi:hypothetical protein